MQFTARERGLQHVAGIDRAFGLAGADHRVQLVDEHDRAALVRSDVLQYGFQAFLEFAAILGAGKELRHVERQHALVLQRLRHFAIDDPLRQAFDDRSLADARLADQDGIVLRAPLQDLDRAANFVVATNDGVELAFAGTLGKVDRVFLERFALALCFLRIDACAAADRLDRGLQRFAREAVVLEQTTGVPFVVGQREQEQLAGDELIAAFPRFLVGEIQQIVEIARHADLAAGAFDLRQSLDRLFERRLQPRHGNTGPRKQRRGPAVFLRQHCRQQMLRLDEAGVVAEREALGVGERLLKFGRQFVEAHGNPLSTFTVWVFAVRFQHRRRSFELKQQPRRVARPESANTCLRVPGATVSVDPPPRDGRTTRDGPSGLLRAPAP